MNKYLQEATEENNKKFLPATFLEYSRMHPSQARLVPMSHIKKLRDEYQNGKTDGMSRLKGDSDFVNNPIKWE